jgi:Ser/Thr protein kinase RdoA (MazF antagonist)
MMPVPVHGRPPRGETAQRTQWSDLPEWVRALIESQLAGRVVSAVSQGAGFTPGFTSRLLLDDGRRAFVKAANATLQPEFALSYREEIRKLAALPATVPAPRLRWHLDGDWVLLGFDDVGGAPPQRPWQPGELTRVCEALVTTAAALTPPPAELDLSDLRSTLLPELGRWERVRTQGLAEALIAAHLGEASALAAEALDASSGNTMVHTDLRDDNILIDHNERVWIVDWNWPVVGAAWFDLVTLLISAQGDGIDTDALLVQNPLTADVDPQAIDAMIALLYGYFVTASVDPAVNTSPYLRQHQDWYARATARWLAIRRGWLP